MTIEILAGSLLIFCLRLADVAAGTLRISMLVRGYRLLAGGVSFLESLLWLVATAKALTGLDNPLKFVAFAAGYAVGTSQINPDALVSIDVVTTADLRQHAISRQGSPDPKAQDLDRYRKKPQASPRAR